MASKLVRLVGIILLALPLTIEGSPSESGQTVVVNGIDYYVPPDAVTVISASSKMLASSATSGLDLIPLTVLVDTSDSFTTSVFESLVNNYTSSDDVFNTGFLQGK
jgi:hypothetical protein